MKLKLFRVASNDPTQCFKVLEHTHLSCRTCHILALAQVTSLLLNWYKPSVLHEFSKSEATWAKASVWQVLQLKCGCSNNLKHCVWSLEASRKSFKVIAQKQKKISASTWSPFLMNLSKKTWTFSRVFCSNLCIFDVFCCIFFQKMALEFFLDVVFTYYKKLKHAGTCSSSSGKLFICTKSTRKKKFGVKTIFGAWGSLWILLL